MAVAHFEAACRALASGADASADEYLRGLRVDAGAAELAHAVMISSADAGAQFQAALLLRDALARCARAWVSFMRAALMARAYWRGRVRPFCGVWHGVHGPLTRRWPQVLDRHAAGRPPRRARLRARLRDGRVRAAGAVRCRAVAAGAPASVRRLPSLCAPG